MILQTFQNPVWTQSEVGSIYLCGILIVAFLAYNLIDSIREIIQDFKKRKK
jgi:hypothetical protein